MTLHLFNFNNYYNRQIKVHSKITDYPTELAIIEYINFNPNDGISTEQVLNYTGPAPDYLIATDDNEIVSRWFVIQAQRTRAQQYKLTLYRDLVADHLEQIIDAPMFVEKATLTASSKFIYNDENYAVNQIKKDETLLKDETGVPWIVGYLAKSEPGDPLSTEFKMETPYDFEVADLSTEDIWIYRSSGGAKDLVMPNKLTTRVAFNDSNTYTGGNYFEIDGWDYSLKWGGTKAAYGKTNGYSLINPPLGANSGEIQRRIQAVWSTAEDAIWNGISAYNVDMDSTLATSLLAYNGLTVKDLATNKYYQITAKTTAMADYLMYVDIKSGALFNTLKTKIDEANNAPVATELGGKFFLGEANDKTFSICVFGERVDIRFTELTAVRGEITVPKGPAARVSCWDAPYDIICAPYGDYKIYTSDPAGTAKYYIQSKDTAYAALQAFAAKYSGGETPQLYDLQLLPYCPIREYMRDGGIWAPNTDSYGTIKKIISESPDEEIGRVFFVSKSKFELNIIHKIDIPTDATERKVVCQCDMYRLCSPNYNGVFEFNPVKNNGVSYFNVDCTYKPFQPYIHINPNFGGLYGSDYDDARGLICGGDFSLPMTSDKWDEYERQNKNYQQMFDRQIENLEVQHTAQRIQELAGGAAGIGQGAASGALIGSMIPGLGTAVGAAAGALVSGIGMVGDLFTNEMLRNETIDYTKDQFGMQLDNIKALPLSLTRTTAYTNNNKIFPFIEYYTCYNGFTVGVIGTLGEFRQPTETYIKGKLIRLEGIEASFEVANALAAELNKGVFI